MCSFLRWWNHNDFGMFDGSNASSFLCFAVFADDDRFWEHYQIVMDGSYPLMRISCQLGADVIVFMRWLGSALDEKGHRSVYDRIRTFVGEEVYDPLFDQDEKELKESETKLAEMYWRTKTFVEEENGEEVQNPINPGRSLFNKWKELAWNGQKWKPEEDELHEVAEWIRKLHRKEFAGLLRGERRDNLATSKWAKNKNANVFFYFKL